MCIGSAATFVEGRDRFSFSFFMHGFPGFNRCFSHLTCVADLKWA